jgi:hypothetical protein
VDALNRRGFLSGLLAAPAVIRTPGLLMLIRPELVRPSLIITAEDYMTSPLAQAGHMLPEVFTKELIDLLCRNIGIPGPSLRIELPMVRRVPRLLGIASGARRHV